MLIRKLFRTACHYKVQFISMIIMIAIGVGIFLGFNVEWRSIEKNAEIFFEETNYADFRLYSERGFSSAEIDSIKQIDGIEEATRYFNMNVSIKNTKKSLALNVSEDYNVSTMKIIDGIPYDSGIGGMWISDKFAKENKLEIGDILTLSYQGIYIDEKINGLIKSGENLVSVVDENQIMPDYKSFGFAYISKTELLNILGYEYYPQINIISSLEKQQLQEKIYEATNAAYLITSKDEHIAYAAVKSESEEGRTMGTILPVLFLAIAMLQMVTTMHRISTNEKVQIGTLKALGFKDRKILTHYTSYGLTIGLIGTILGILIGFLIAYIILNPKGMMSTYLDMPNWNLYMPSFCIPVLIIMLVILTLISFLSVKKMLRGSASESLRPYTPKVHKKFFFEKGWLWNKMTFGIKWNIRDIMRHKSRTIMTLLGVIGCTILLVGSFGMRDTMNKFINILDKDINEYATKIVVSDNALDEEVKKLMKEVGGDFQSTSGINYAGKTISLDIYNSRIKNIGFLTEDNEELKLGDDGVYLCLRLKDTAMVGDVIEFSPYGSEYKYNVKVAGFFRSLVSESIVMTDTYANKIGIEYKINCIYTNKTIDEIEKTRIISTIQDKETIMDSYGKFMEIMNTMIVVLAIAAIVLGIVVLYNLGVMSYVERYRELSTLKVLGFKDSAIRKLLVSQNSWITFIGIIFGIPAGIMGLKFLLKALVNEYELSLYMGWSTYLVSIILTFGISLLVGLMVSQKNKKIDMVEALKGID